VSQRKEIKRDLDEQIRKLEEKENEKSK